MARVLRVALPGGKYHVTACGNERRDFFCQDRDRLHFLELLAIWFEQFAIRLVAYVLMDNNYQLVLETPEANSRRALRRYTEGANHEKDMPSLWAELLGAPSSTTLPNHRHTSNSKRLSFALTNRSPASKRSSPSDFFELWESIAQQWSEYIREYPHNKLTSPTRERAIP